MIVEKMTPEEAYKEVLEDFNSTKKCWDRLGKDYDKIRKKNNIAKDRTYSKAYPIISKKKNKWFFLLSKAPSVEKYKRVGNIDICSILISYSTIGLRVFKVMPTGGLSVYNSHLFKRYRERLNLDIEDPLETVKAFFMRNGYFASKVIQKDGREFTITTCKDGILLGEIQHNRKFLVQKTFINRDIAFSEQKDIEADLYHSIEENLLELVNDPDFNRVEYNFKADVLKGIQPND